MFSKTQQLVVKRWSNRGIMVGKNARKKCDKT